MNIRLAVLLVLAALASCAARPPAPARGPEIFDEQTASSLLVVAHPLVFARTRSDVAAHAHDFATFVAVEVDNSGRNSDYLLLYRWSTVDPRFSPPPAPESGEALIIADGRVIHLQPLERLPVSLDRRRELHVPEHGEIVAHAYKVDTGLLQFIAASRELSVRMPKEQLDTPFALWGAQGASGLHALGQFVLRTRPL